MYEIIPRLYLGNAQDAEYNKNYYTHVVNCTVDIPFFIGKGLRIPVHDSQEEQDAMLEMLPNVMLYIDYVLSKDDQKILVHCFMGRQRSAAVIAAYLLWKGITTTAQESLDMIRRLKKDAFYSRVTFWKALAEWQDYIQRRDPHIKLL